MQASFKSSRPSPPVVRQRGRAHAIARHVCLPLVLGGLIYVIARPTTLLLFRWLETLGLEGAVSALRTATVGLVSCLPDFVVYSAPNGLWSYALCVSGYLRSRNSRAPMDAWVPLAVAASVMPEMAQLVHLLPGTFDPLDLTACVAGVLAAGVLFRRATVPGWHASRFRARHWSTVGTCLFFGVLAGGSFDSKGSKREETSSDEPERSQSREIRRAGDESKEKISNGTRVVRNEEFGDRWPFKVPAVKLRCGDPFGATSDGHLIWSVGAEANGKTYALNGVARGHAKELLWEPEIASIWRDSPSGSLGPKIDLTPMIAIALETCESEPWYSGGTLHEKTGLDWQLASAPNKLATCADLMAVVWQKGLLKPSVAPRINGVDDLKPLAAQLVVALNNAFKDAPEGKTEIQANLKVADASVILFSLMGWLK